MQTPLIRCDCCGLLIGSYAEERCPRCDYPVNPNSEEQFLTNALRDLERIATYGGANLSIAGLIVRYKTRLDYLRKYSLSAQQLAKGQAVSSPNTGSEIVAPVAPPMNEQMTPVGVLAPAASASAGAEPRSAEQLPPRRMFSLRTFLVDQAITIVASLGAFLVLIGALSFIVTTPNDLRSFLVVFGVQALFGITGVVTNRFPSFRTIARIYTGIFTLLVPLTGFAAYGLIEGNYIHLSVPALIAIAAAYAAVVYGALAIYQRFALFGYLGAMALVVTDLALARHLNLGTWWWPSTLMILALVGLVALPRPDENTASPIRRLFTGPRAVLRGPVRVLALLIVVVCVLGIPTTTLYALSLDALSHVNREVRFSILSMTTLLLLWTGSAFWLVRRTRGISVLAYLLLASILSCCYALDFRPAGYVLALLGVAMLYAGFSHFASRLLQPLKGLGLHLDGIALVLVGLLPLIGFPALPFQLLGRAYHIPHLADPIPWNGETVVELVAILLGLGLTLSISLHRTRLRNAAGASGNAWPWLLLLSSLLLNSAYGVVVLLLDVEPVWAFLGLTLLLLVGSVVVRRWLGSQWANPLDMLVLSEMVGTLMLSLSQSIDTISTLLLFFAALSYVVLLYQRRPVLLVISFLFALFAQPLLVTRPRTALVMSILLPLAAIVVRRLVSLRRATVDANNPTLPVRIMPWEWPLLATGLLVGVLLTWQDFGASEGIIQGWIGFQFPIAVEIALISLTWYASAVLGRVKPWLLPVVGFAFAAVLVPGNNFWALAAVTPILALLGLGVSRFAGRDWALPLYSVALLSAVMTGFAAPIQGHLSAATWILFGFALLAYLLALVEDVTWVMWVAPVFAIWSVIDAAILGDLYRPPIVAITCAALGVGIGLLRQITLPFLAAERKRKLLSYALPLYGTALAAAVLTGFYGTVSGINNPFYTAIPDILLIYAVVAFGVVHFERRPGWLWLVASFATWGVLLGAQITAYYITVIGLGLGVIGLVTGRFIQSSAGGTPSQSTKYAFARFTWNWPWYVTGLIAAVLIGFWPSLPLIQAVNGFIGWSLLAFTVLAAVIMLVERAPELLVFPVGLAALAIWRWQPQQELMMSAYTLLCVVTFASQFVWKIVPPATNRVRPAMLHRFLGLGGQALVVVWIIAQNGTSADAGLLTHVGAGALFVLALLLYWFGHLQARPEVRNRCTYGAGFLASLVIPWELSAFHLTNGSLLSLGPATYLLVIAPVVARDESLPERHRIGQVCSVLGAALLLLPTLWLSFGDSDNNLLYTVILLGESLALLVLGIVIRMRVFVLTGAALVILAALRTLFLPSLGIPIGLALAGLGGILLVVATGLSLARHRLQTAWTHWD